MAEHDIMTMRGQTAIHADFARDRFKDVLGKSFTLKSGHGRDYLLHRKIMKETYELALEECPQAADTIAVLLWHAVLTHNRLEFLAKADDDLAKATGQ